MLKAIISAGAILLGAATAFAQGIASPQMSEAACQGVWTKAGAASPSATLTQAQTQPYVLDFNRVDTDSDQKVSSAEFLIACQHGMVRDTAITGRSSGSGENSDRTVPRQLVAP